MNISENIKFHLHSNCIPVKGSKRSSLCDLQSNKYYLIPNDLYNIINKYKNHSICDVKAELGNSEEIDNYFIFLCDNNLIFFDDNVGLFPDLSLRWDDPYSISNAIIDINSQSSFSVPAIVKMLDDLNCPCLQVRSYNYINIEYIQEIMDSLEGTIILSVDWIIQFHEDLEMNDFAKLSALLRKYPRIFSITICNSSRSGVIVSPVFGYGSIMATTQKITDSSHCGLVNQKLFSVGIKLFSEAQLYNSCLNKKIAIDVNGNIKNCPSMLKSYGNIKNSTLIQALKMEGFSDVWYINKDKVKICKDCEFRYICTDCRAYIENPDDVYSKPLKCGYSPYDCTWEDWSINPIKYQSKEFYGITN